MVNLRQVEVFRAVMREKTVTRAAQALHISQPAASRLINDLEYYIGFNLFVHGKGKLAPTPEAHALFEEVERSFSGLERIISAARDIREFKTGRLFVCAMPSLSLSLLPDTVNEFATEHPDISISLQVHSSQRVMQWVATQQCDVGFIGMNIEDPGVKRLLLATSPLKLVMRNDHPLAEQTQLSPPDIADQRFVFVGQQLDVRDDVEQAFCEADISLDRRLETQLSAVACELVLAGAGVTLVESVTAKAYSNRGLVARDFAPAIPFKWCALLPAFRAPSRLATEFINEVRRTLEATLCS